MTAALSFQRAERAITALCQAGHHLSLDALAAEAGLSPSHFQREFKRMTGLSPKQMSQLLTRERLLAAIAVTDNVLDATLLAGLSSTSRAQELILTTDGATPAQLKRGGRGVEITYGSHVTQLGTCFVARTVHGLCKLEFSDDDAASLAALAKAWPNAILRQNASVAKTVANAVIRGDRRNLPCHVKGTNFQLKVWQALMQLPASTLVTYGGIAKALGLSPVGARAVGNAVGANPVAVVIPCHRVIRESGAFGGYRWGLARKSVLVARELHAAPSQRNVSG